MAALALVVAAGACGTSGTEGEAAPAGTDAPRAAGTIVGTTPATPGSSTTTEPSTAAGFTGTYVLSGTQTCRTPGGAAPEATTPLFDGSTITFDGANLIVDLRNEPLTVPVTIDGPSFVVDAAFDLDGNLVSGPPGAIDLPLTVDGTSDDEGATFTATASDAGVNCRYELTGRRGDATTPSSATSTSVVPVIADPCSHIADPATGRVYDEWTHAGPGLGPVHLVVTCEAPWAEATFDPGPGQPLLVHWDGSLWTLTDDATFCATYTGPKPSSLPGEGQPGNIWIARCTTPTTPPTTIVAPTYPTGPTDHD